MTQSFAVNIAKQVSQNVAQQIESLRYEKLHEKLRSD